MSTPMFGPRHNVGERPGQRIASNLIERMQAELYAARGTSADGPLMYESGPSGTSIGLERSTIDLRRFVLTEDLPAGGSAEASILVYDNDTLQWTIIGETFTVYDSLGNADGSTALREGQYGFAKWFGDNGLWEIIPSGALSSDDFFVARLDSHTGATPIVYAWTEMEFTSEIAAATVKSGGRTGTTAPASWRATELNNNSVADNTIVWMRREFKPASPAVAVVTKTLAGNGAGTHAKFSLYLDQVTSGTFTLTFDGTTTAAIAYNATGATIKTAIQTAVAGLTLSAFAGLGTLASPYTFSVSSDANDHTTSSDASALKDGSGFRFDMGGASSEFDPCLADALPDTTGAYKVVVQNTSTKCLEVVPVSTCTTPVDIFGGTH